jgi:hypothetical protein
MAVVVVSYETLGSSVTKLIGFVRVSAHQKPTDRQRQGGGRQSREALAITSRSRHPSSERAWIVG